MGQDPFGEIPLFKELQRLLAGGTGPINLEIARQVATSIAGADDGSTGGDVEKDFSTAVREAEMLLSGYSRLTLDEPARTSVMTRPQWVAETLTAWNWVFERLASRFTSVLGEPEGGSSGAGVMGVMGQIVPLLMGLQVGTLVGHLADDVLGRFDLPIPREDDERLFLVPKNALEVASRYGLEKDDLVRWIALQEAGRRLVLQKSSWIKGYFRSVVAELIDSVEIDIGDIERRMMEVQSQGLEAMQDLAGSGALPVVQTPRHQTALGHYQAFVSVFEGYATHAAMTIATEWLPGAAKINEGMIRRAASPSEGKTALQNVLGLSFDRSLTAAGTTFCAAVVQLRGISDLNRVWMAPDNLPTADEIRDPFIWIERVLDDASSSEFP